ncbi:Abi family protein [Modicisalibacter tunisiensis]|uniref:Abi family protein n=1 Tax=Modicisalibacter tunisiensis TaxID=390637 RepID=A0ABS7WW43_9GAMM|nr:Abi family protein [Modicisalibacter tunisiensis]MBZ9539788.1 Abi family protein [Modicisalibacter tunisiensis]MBZ9566823.1 Abi family protein [Modicisalibacter tunisiensis]
MRFNKPPLTHDAQLDLLIQRGLTVPDRQRALHYLRHLNYYRLGAYWLPFEADHQTHLFRPGTALDDVLNLYIFDREFRLLVMDAIERIEVSIRTDWAYHMAHTHGPHCHLDRSLFKPAWRYEERRHSLEKEVQRSQETFIRHLREKYDEPLPPIWALVEVMTFGQLSQWLANTRQRRDRNAVAREYDFDESVLCSVLHHLSTVRNLCAHHARLWNREFTLLPKLPSKRPQPLVGSLHNGDNRKIYNTLTLMAYLMDAVNPRHHWRERLIQLIDQHGVDTSAMGFPDDWRARQLWMARPH